MQIGWGGLVFTRLEQAEGGEAPPEAGGGVPHKEENGGGGTTTENNNNNNNNKNGTPGSSKGSSGDASSLRRRKGGDGKQGGPNGKAEEAVEGPGAGGVVGEGKGPDQAMETMRYDRMAIAYLSLLLLPLVVGYSAKKLVMDEHASWYSWSLQSVTVRQECYGKYRRRLYDVRYHTPWTNFQSLTTPRHTGCQNKAMRFRKALDKMDETDKMPQFSAPPSFFLESNRALKNGPGGVISFVTYGRHDLGAAVSKEACCILLTMSRVCL